jgi:predicted RNase H-like HicB family nuclease
MMEDHNDLNRYSIRIHFSAEDHAYIAEVPELLGCKADGDTYENAVRSVLCSVRTWLETAAKLKREAPSPVLYAEYLVTVRERNNIMRDLAFTEARTESRDFVTAERAKQTASRMWGDTVAKRLFPGEQK